MKRSIFSLVAIAAVPAVLAAQNPPTRDTTRVDSTRADSVRADSAKQGTAPGRAVNPTNESGDTTRSALRDSLLRAGQGAVVERGGEVARTSRGARSSSRNFGLDRSQVMQLQEALNGIGCDVGTVDGVVGPRTRAAMTCARSQKGVTGGDNQALFQALNLDFGGTGAAGAADTTGTADSTRMRDSSTMRDSAEMRDSSAMRRDSTTTRPDSTRPDSTRGTPPL